MTGTVLWEPPADVRETTRIGDYLRWLARDPACTLPLRLELAACGLKVSGHELTTEARASDPSLAQFIALCQHFDVGELFERLQSIRWLAPEDLHYLGFHLAEYEGRPRKFAGQVLQLVVKRSPRSKLAQAAKSKLRVTGF